jgi:hypothetical protein
MEYLVIIIVMVLIYLFLKSQIAKTSVSNILSQSTQQSLSHNETIVNNNVMPLLHGPGTFSINIVGESHYQDALNELCGGKTRDGHDIIVKAELIHEDDNPFDDKAIRIDINGMTVGYFSKKIAREY